MSVLGIAAWAFSPTGRVVLIGLAVLAAIVFIDRRATFRERARCDAAIIQSKLDAANADLKAERDAREQDKKISDDLAAEKATAEARTDELQKRIDKLPLGDRCIVGPDNARRMSN